MTEARDEYDTHFLSYGKMAFLACFLPGKLIGYAVSQPHATYTWVREVRHVQWPWQLDLGVTVGAWLISYLIIMAIFGRVRLKTSPFRGRRADNHSSSVRPAENRFSNRELTGLAGSMLLLIGAFTPILSVPVMGSISFFQQGWQGYLLLALAIGSAIMIFPRRERGLRITAGGSLCFVLYSLISLQIKLMQMKKGMDTGEDELFAGLAKLAANSIQLQWGWGVLLLGSLLLVVAAFTSGLPQVEPVLVTETIATSHSVTEDVNFRGGVADEIRKLKVLLDEGILTPQEFELQKQKLLG
jgi:hypothetical protein